MSKSNVLIRGKQKRARAFFERNQLAEAEAAYLQITATQRLDFEAWHMLGTISWKRGDAQAAETRFGEALKIRPDDAVVQYNLACTQLSQGKRAAALAGLRRAVALKSDFPDPLITLGNLLAAGGELGEAADCYRAALRLQTANPVLHSNLGNVLADQGRIDEAVASWRQALALRPDHAAAHSNLLLALNYDPRNTPQAIYREHRAWAARHAAPLRGGARHPNPPDPERRLRVGYVSADFREHSVAYFIEPILAAHDPERVEIHAYADVSHPDDTTRRMQKRVAHFHVIAGLSDEQLAARIRADGIDILVDLAGHTAGNRLLAFARRPAPVQVSYLGYPNTTGMDAMQYRLTDAWADPPGTTEVLHSETLVRLPRGFLCYAPPAAAPEVAVPPSRATGHVTFGAFNYTGKTTPDCLALWARILAALPDARLIMKNKALTDAATRERYLGQLTAHGIDAARIELIGLTRSKAEHLAVYQRVDIALDSFPYNGTTTTCDTLWMGVPVVTLAGSTHAGRVGVSLLLGLGLSELVAADADDYMARALALARDADRLAALRARLRDTLARSPLCDARGFTAQLEQAYRDMWRTWCTTPHPNED